MSEGVYKQPQKPVLSRSIESDTSKVFLISAPESRLETTPIPEVRVQHADTSSHPQRKPRALLFIIGTGIFFIGGIALLVVSVAKLPLFQRLSQEHTDNTSQGTVVEARNFFEAAPLSQETFEYIIPVQEGRILSLGEFMSLASPKEIFHLDKYGFFIGGVFSSQNKEYRFMLVQETTSHSIHIGQEETLLLKSLNSFLVPKSEREFPLLCTRIVIMNYTTCKLSSENHPSLVTMHVPQTDFLLFTTEEALYAGLLELIFTNPLVLSGENATIAL